MHGRAPEWKPDLYVVARILEHLWRSSDPMLKTRLQVAANVNYDVFKRYLEWLMTSGLASLTLSNDGHEKVSLTAKGAMPTGVSSSGSMRSCGERRLDADLDHFERSWAISWRWKSRSRSV